MEIPEPKRRWAELRRAAESRLRTHGADALDLGGDQTQLIHELQVHQVELEMQKDELIVAQAEVARSFVRYQRLFDLAPVACVTLDRTGRVQDCNSRAATLFGVGRSQLGGQPLQKFMPQLAADILHRHLRSVFAGSAKQECTVALEQLGTKRGSFPVRIESIVVPEEAGQRVQCQSMLVNLSEVHGGEDALRTPQTATTTADTPAHAIAGSDAKGTKESPNKATERLDSLREQRDVAERMLATAPVIVLVLDLDGGIVRFNRCFEDITGYDLDEVRGADWFTTFLPEHDKERLREAFARTLRGEITSAMIHPIRTKGGGVVEIEWHDTLLRDGRANVCARLSIGLHATKRRQLEESQRLAAVGEFAAGVAREIHNPVNSIFNHALLLLDGAPVRDSCKIILEQGAKVSGIVKHLQQFARGERWAPQSTSLADVINRTILALGENLERHGIRFQVEVPVDLPTVLAHAQQLQQVLLNLLTNARDALQSIRTGVRLVTVRAVVEDGVSVSCSVRDNGPGIPPDFAPRIFEPFVTTKRALGGAGLGLSVSKSIIESFGGKLTVRSVPGQFAEFTFELPLAASS